MKNLLNNFKKNLNDNRQITLLFILASVAFVELLALIYASHIIYLSQKQKTFARSNIFPSLTLDQEQIKNFQTLILASDIDYIRRGKLRFHLGDYQGAINDLKQAINLNNINRNTLSKSIALAYFELANSEILFGFYREPSSKVINRNLLLSNIRDNSNSAIKFDPDFANAYYLRGYLSYYKIPSNFPIGYGKRNSKEAINKAVEKGIFNEPIILNMINDFTNAIRNDPFFYKNYPYIFNFKTINPYPIFSDEYPSRINKLAEKIKINSNDDSLYYQRALIYLESNNHQKAIEDLNKVIQSNFSNNSLKSLAYYSLWVAYYKQKHYQKALENINQVIKIYPNYPDFYAIRGLTYYDFYKLSMNTKYLEKVIEDCNHAIKLKPHANAYFIRGLAYYDRGNQARALSDYIEALPQWSWSIWPYLIIEGQVDKGSGIRDIPLPPDFPPKLSQENY